MIWVAPCRSSEATCCGLIAACAVAVGIHATTNATSAGMSARALIRRPCRSTIASVIDAVGAARQSPGRMVERAKAAETSLLVQAPSRGADIAADTQ
jgi:hypothetical protein